VRCPRCGNENPAGNRFCGMCGATLLAPTPAPPQPAHQPPRSAPVPTPIPTPEPIRRPAPEAPRTASRIEDEPPSIAGPSFLGLNDPRPERKRASFQTNPSSRSSNLDYLLDDVEEPKGGGAGKVFFILLALALAVGFGYLRFKDHGFPWVTKENKPAPTADAPSASDTNAGASPATTSPSAASPRITPEPQPAPSQSASSAPPSQPASQPPPPSPDSGETQPNSNTNPAPTAKPSEAAPPASDAASGKPAEAAPNSDDAANASKNENKDAAKNSTESAAANPDAEAPAAKPHAATRPVDPLAEAQKYIYGRGVPQDCDRGLRLLKPMATQKNPKAMIEMGALYSAGLCTPHDLPTAYYWFALASRKDPSNESINADLQKLWGEMTQPERQLAIKLTQ
jgi:outer membrane biosynthesis protein TonB